MVWIVGGRKRRIAKMVSTSKEVSFGRDDPSSEEIDPANDDDSSVPENLDDPSSEEIDPVKDDASSDSVNSWSCRSDELKKIKDQLTSRIPLSLKVVPIVGMGGIGKTTLATSVYEDTHILYHFHIRAWTTISQQYKLRNALLGLLISMNSVPAKVSELGNDDLADVLRKSLKGRKFLIVLDDMWNIQTWDDFKGIIPDDCNGSRVLLTSRHVEVAQYAAPESTPHSMNCLSNEESRRLLLKEVFVGKPCPSDLVEIGKGIAKKCQGLPLAVVVVAGHLSKIDKNQNGWADVAKRLDSLLTGNAEQILDILYLSYNYLPQHLKACFLYTGIFPKNSEINVLKLIWLWSAVGFLHSEDEAEKYLEDLINRNLIMVRKKKSDGTPKTCGMHDLLWDLSLREARKESHYAFSHFRHSDSTATIDDDDMEYVVDHTSTYLYFGCSFDTDFPYTSGCNRFSLLRVLDIQSVNFSLFPEIITSLVGLRYLELETSHIPETVSRLCNLETLIIRCHLRNLFLPKKIWLLSRLRHLQVGRCTLFPDSCVTDSDGSSGAVFPELQTLSTLSFASCTEQVFSRVPKIKRLKIFDINGREDENLFNFLSNLVHVHHLEKLNLEFSTQVRRGQQQISWCDFLPQCVKQLSLSGSHLKWEDMNILAMLPNLEVLKLRKHAFSGPIYKQTVEGFPRLKVLLFENLDLQKWIAETIHYPFLQQLVLRGCCLLEGIPFCFGEIPTLESIELVSCSKSVVESAKTIQQEQENLGNYNLQFRIHRLQRGHQCYANY